MRAHVGNAVLTAAIVALLAAAVALWLLPIERWLPEPLPVAQGRGQPSAPAWWIASRQPVPPAHS